jgi:hypothetical protein
MRGEARKLSRAIWRNAWNELVNLIECDITGLKRRGFKYLRNYRY